MDGILQKLSSLLAGTLGRLWDFLDERDIDKHVVSVFIMVGTYDLTRWAMKFAMDGDRPGLEVAAIIGAVFAPYMALQAAVVAWYFKARNGQ